MASKNKDYKPEDIAFPEQVIVQSELVNEMKDENAKNMAQNEWITPALNGDYAPMLGASDAGEEPSVSVFGKK